MTRAFRRLAFRYARGLSLVELMVSLALGLLLVGGAITVFMSSRQTYRITEGLSRLQETTRVAFELMARDFREAGATACEAGLPVGYAINSPTSEWWRQWDGATSVLGVDGSTALAGLAFGTAVGTRLAGTDAVQIKTASTTGAMVETHATLADPLTVTTVNHGLVSGDLAMVCTFEGSTIFQVTSAGPTSRVIAHAAGGTQPGNSTANLAVNGVRPLCRFYDPANCTNWPAIVAKLGVSRWYVGNNARGTSSLYRTALQNVAGALSLQTIEVAENVSGLQVRYLVGQAYVPAASVADWSTVSAVRLELGLATTENVGTGATPLTRTMQHTVALRNRSQ